jgi:leader peptidase (prepilin peptidase)/N-methyltransferase
MDDFVSQLEGALAGPLGRVAAAAWGALWGSFFNVVIVRVPREESIVRPASHCCACRAPIAWHDNIPIASYLILRGRCRRCGARFSARYLVVELIVAALALAMHQQYVVPQSGGLGLRVAQLVITSLFCGLLVAVAFIDLDTLRIPDVITYPAIPTAMLLSLFMGHPHLWDGAVGGAAGYLGIRLLADGYRLLTGRVGMGYGDAKLLAVIGGLLGWQALVPTLFLAAFQGSVFGIAVLLVVRRRAGPTPPPPESTTHDGDVEGEPPSSSLRHARIPFGPFLSLAAVELLLARGWLPTLFPFFY